MKKPTSRPARATSPTKAPTKPGAAKGPATAARRSSEGKAGSLAPARPASRSTKSAARTVPTRRVILGLLGGIASGKSTVSAILAAGDRGVVFDADAVARECLDLTARDGRLAEALGPWAVTSSSTADRKAISRRVFDEPALLRALERIIHPVVLARIEDAIEGHRAGKGAPILVLDVPLLIEAGLDRRCDALWFVDAPDEDRFARAASRLGLTREEVLKRESAQSPLDRKRARADLVLDNSGSLDDLRTAVVEGMRSLGI